VLRRLWTIPVLALLLVVGLSLAKPAFADVPKVINVVAWKSGGNVMLNVTVYHNSVGAEMFGHYVDIVRVDVGGSVQDFPQSSPHTYYDLVNHYFNISVGPVTGITGTPTATVSAHCIINLWSLQDWIGQIPEFAMPLLLAFFVASFVVVFVHRRGELTFANR
jgi:hypothetical protein